MNSPQRPKPSIAMTPDEIMAFLRTGKPAAVCVPDANGRLVARMAPYRLQGNDAATAVQLMLEGDAADLPAGKGACVLVDTYPSYAQIKEVLLRGTLDIDGDGGRRVGRLNAEKVSGYDFEKIPKAR